MGSASECEYHLLLSRDLELLTTENHDQLHTQVSDVKRMLAAFIVKLKTDN